ncbi:MAG TPA: YidC/Oxa1 family membrane protein insertase [Dehalococcoidia bacterium]|nr:YidC/Oxa1 family membrane protein insertase [Dehalococcoidia bacterium]
MDLIIQLFQVALVDPMTNVLVAIARLSGGNFGISIIIFTLVMRFVTWPLTASQYKQSKKMQELQPRLQELQKKYKGKDPKKLQQETMALYKEGGVNPLGCLFPMLVQFPIWIALYQVINRTLGETPESFVTLSQTLYPIPFVHEAVPLNNRLLFWNLGANDTTYILPILVAVTMYVQQKLITPVPTVAATPQQQQQQQTMQMMTWMMPAMFFFFASSAPAGLGVYWAISNISGIILQYFYMGRRMDWRQLLQFGPPSAAPAGSAALRGGVRAKPPADTTKKGAEAPEVPADVSVSESGEATIAQPQSGRRNKHGRRRGKR